MRVVSCNVSLSRFGLWVLKSSQRSLRLTLLGRPTEEFRTSDRLARSSGDVSRYHIALEPAHRILAQACLGVLLRLDDRIIEDNIDGIPLVEYASRHLFDHAGFEKVASHIRDAMEYF